MADIHFRRLLRQAKLNNSNEDMNAAYQFGKKLGMSPWEMLDAGISLEFLAEDISAEKDHFTVWQITYDELAQTGIDPDSYDTWDGEYLDILSCYYPVAAPWDEKVPINVLPDHRVVAKPSGEPPYEVIDDSWEDIVALAERDEIIKEARRIYAEQYAGKDPILRKIIAWHMEYNRGRLSKPTYREGIPFWAVGRNASCEFSVGYQSGQLYRYSWCYGDDEENPITEVDGFSGYWGHF